MASGLKGAPEETEDWIGLIKGQVSNNINNNININNNNDNNNTDKKEEKENTIIDSKNNIIITTKKDSKGNYKIVIKKDIKKDIKIKPPKPVGYHTRLPEEYIAVLDVLKENTGYYKYELDKMAYDLLFKKYGIVIEKE